MTLHVCVRLVSSRLLLAATEKGGREMFQMERFRVGVEPAPDSFTLEPSTESGRGK